ncbi:MAG: acylphosphatase [Pseudomonadota bacterium]|nr:acylphosphatase [Pseudomonadota bacterium]MDE3037924.1 acylphosphatase [Pseudomonadota bacterium]
MADARRVVISGRVQGVGFRAWTVATARNFNLQGWVRNCSNGTVEAVFSGEETNITAMIESCKSGPPAARVESIDQFSWKEEITGGFIARPTA